jgi:hypothetical protein
MDRWREFNLNVLFDLIQTQMPLGNPRGLQENVYVDISAYILQSNGLPSGTRELTVEMLPETLLVGSDGPKPLPSSSQIIVAGCMTEDSGNGWFLTSASEPARTLDAFQLTVEELKDAKERPLGNLVFRLQNLSDLAGFTTEGTIGNKMVAKGIVVRQEKGDRINVTALRTVAPSCEPEAAHAENH